MNWFIKLSQLQPFLKSLGLADDLINLIQKINIKEVRNKVIKEIQVGGLKDNLILSRYIQLLINNYNTLITLTDNPHYKKWLINKYLDYSRLEEDKDKFKETLLRLKRSSLDKNINNYQDIPDIAYKLDNTKNQINKRNKSGELLNLPDGATLLGTTENGFTVVKITTVPAANILADGTEWCVKNEGPAKRYLSKGPLYLVYKNNQRYALCHYEDNQFMDVYDNPLEDNDLWTMIIDIGELTKIGITNDANLAYRYVDEVERDEFPPGEDAIATNGYYSYRYALMTKKPFPKGEDAISQLGLQSILYAADVLHKRFLKAEPLILQSPVWCVEYAEKVIKGRWPEAEPIILTNEDNSISYAIKVLKPFEKEKRFILGEPLISQYSRTAYLYAKEIIQGRWKIGEEAIAQNGYYSVEYAKNVLMGRFEQGEKEIIKEKELAFKYLTEAVKYRVPYVEQAFAKDGELSFKYAMIIKERFIEGEEAMKPYASYWYIYQDMLNQQKTNVQNKE